MAKQGRYESYRDSGTCYLGDVPSSWETKQLTKRSVEGCVNGVWGQEPTESSDNIVVIRVADFDRPRLGVSDVKFTMRDIPEKDRIRRRLRRGDLLLEKSGGGENQQVGQVVLFDMDIEAVTSNFVARLRPHGGVDSDYLNYAFSSLYRDRMNTCSIKQNTGIQNLDSSAYLAEQWAFPSHTEQKQIAAFLDYETAKIDALIEKQQQLIALLGEKRQAVISHAVTKGLNPDAPMRDSGVEWLGQVPEHWEVTPLKYKCELIDGDRSSSYPSGDDLIDEGIPFVSSKNISEHKLTRSNLVCITKEKFDQLRQGKLEPNDLVITVRGTIGNVGVFDPNELGCDTAFINAQMMIMRPRRGLTEFLGLVSQSVAWQEQLDVAAYGSTVRQLSNQVLGNVMISIPPDQELAALVDQTKKTISKFNSLVICARLAETLLQERRTALISAAVTGKIDVRGWKPPSSAARLETEMEVA